MYAHAVTYVWGGREFRATIRAARLLSLAACERILQRFYPDVVAVSLETLTTR
jgi:hypothetical protein